MTRLRPAAARPPAAPAPLPHSTGSEAYRGQANHYDQRTDAFHLWRELLVARLAALDRPPKSCLNCSTHTRPSPNALAATVPETSRRRRATRVGGGDHSVPLLC